MIIITKLINTHNYILTYCLQYNEMHFDMVIHVSYADIGSVRSCYGYVSAEELLKVLYFAIRTSKTNLFDKLRNVVVFQRVNFFSRALKTIFPMCLICYLFMYWYTIIFFITEDFIYFHTYQ